tara:strand:- start:19 stop:774 length:756 start_codon:yes stop_codon:yes gene_type:complete
MGNKNSGRQKWIEKVKFNCKWCDKEIYDYLSNRTGKFTFCNRSCSAKYRVSKFDNHIIPDCKFCGKKVKHYRNQFCSVKCRHDNDKTGSYVNCYVCNKELYMPKHRVEKTEKFYCNHDCRKQDYGDLMNRMRKKLRQMRVSGKKTFPEQFIENLLNLLGIEYISEYEIGNFIIDFYIPSKNLCIEADGDYWHGNKDTDKYIGNDMQKTSIDRDKRKEEFLNENGYTLMRFWETDVKNNRGYVYENIKRAVQ